MTEDEWLNNCRRLCKQIKYLSEKLEWREKPTHSRWRVATSLLLDERRVSIPHLYFKAEYQPGRMGECMSYGLMLRDGKESRRVFMLDVLPAHVRSHKENGRIFFGPHIHLGDERLAQITRPVVSRLHSTTMYRWIERFRRHGRILDNGNRYLSSPFSDDLFGHNDEYHDL